MISHLRTLLVLLLAAFPVQARDSDSIALLERREFSVERSAESPSHRLSLALAYLEGSGWAPEAILAAVRQSALILGQCGVALHKAELTLIGAPDRFGDFYTPISRDLARATRDLGIALAHELAHVLMDNGEHSDEPGNLMREDTAPENTRLSADQCARLRDTGSANGLLSAP